MLVEIVHFFILFAICTLICYFCCKRQHLQRKHKIILAVIVLGICKINAKHVPPVENFFLRYQSPESAFSYLGWGDYMGMEEGENSVLLISKYHSEENYVYLKKEDGKYQAPFSAPEPKVIWNEKNDSTIITLIPETDTKSYYVIVFTTSAVLKENEDHLTVADTQQSDFQRLPFQSKAVDTDADFSFYLYSTYVNQIDESYRIDINGIQYDVNKEMTASNLISDWIFH